MIFCHFCTVAHEEWGELEDVEGYYREVCQHPPGPIWQCGRCLFRIPFFRLWIPSAREHAEPDPNPQDYEQQEMF